MSSTRRRMLQAAFAAVAALAVLATGEGWTASSPRLVARIYDSGFADAAHTYNSLAVASDGRLYYVLSSLRPDVAAQMFVLDPAGGPPRRLADLDEATGNKGRKVIAQGKSHVNFVEADGRLYFGSHLGYASLVKGRETWGVPPAGFSGYPGGHFLAYDMATGKVENLAAAPRGGGIITMNTDARRRRLYGLSWPWGDFFRFDVASREMKTFGTVFDKGEVGEGADYRVICRALAVDPEDGSVYFTRGDGTIYRYRLDRDAVETVRGDNMRKDYFGRYDPATAGNMAYNWRQIVYRPADRLFYGVHGNSGYLFTFDPRKEEVVVLDRITSEPSRRRGMFDQFSYGYLGLTLAPDGRTLYYLTGGPLEGAPRTARAEEIARGASKAEEDLHLVTYDIPTRTTKDHGKVFFADGGRPTYAQSIAVTADGTVYTVATMPHGDATRVDLISFKPSALAATTTTPPFVAFHTRTAVVTFTRPDDPSRYIGYRIVELDPIRTAAPVAGYGSMPLRVGNPSPPPMPEATFTLVPRPNEHTAWKAASDEGAYFFRAGPDGTAYFKHTDADGVRVSVFKPVGDGFETWMWLEPRAEVKGSYLVEQCLRMSGTTNTDARKRSALVPELSEYELWEKGEMRPVSFVRQGDAWKPIAPLTAYAQQSAIKKGWEWISKTDSHAGKDQYVTPPGLTVPEIASLSSGPDRRIDHGLVVREAADGRSVAGMYWERSARVSTHHPADCVHAVVDLGPAAPGRPHVARGKIYWRRGTKDELLAQWKREFR